MLTILSSKEKNKNCIKRIIDKKSDKFTAHKKSGKKVFLIQNPSIETVPLLFLHENM